MGLFDNLTNGITDTFSGGQYKKADKSSQQGVDVWENLQTPELSDLQVELEDAIYRGDVTVEQAQQILQDRSQMYGISLDPKFKEAQMNALQSLQDIGQNKGLTDMDRAQLSKIQSQEAAQQRGSREAILQNAQARGMGGSGLELMSQLQNQQSSADRQAARDTDVAGMAQQRALQALQSAGQLGTQYSDQSFGQQAAIAGAQDRINQFNTQSGNEMSMWNTGQKNLGHTRDANTKQDVSNMNTDIRNREKTHNAGAVQQDYDNRYRKTGGQSGAYQSRAGIQSTQGDKNVDMWGNVIETGGKAYAASDERVKTDVEKFDSSDFLNSLTGYKYNYKDQTKHGKGPQVGVMAQDLEKGAPQAVSTDADGTKVVDYNKLGGPILASLADLNKKVKKMEK